MKSYFPSFLILVIIFSCQEENESSRTFQLLTSKTWKLQRIEEDIYLDSVFNRVDTVFTKDGYSYYGIKNEEITFYGSGKVVYDSEMYLNVLEGEWHFSKDETYFFTNLSTSLPWATGYNRPYIPIYPNQLILDISDSSLVIQTDTTKYYVVSPDGAVHNTRIRRKFMTH